MSDIVSNRDKEIAAQQRFDEVYICSVEIESLLNVSRSNIFYARNRGIIPNPIQVGGSNMYVWEREFLEPYLEAWKLKLKIKRGELI